MTRRQLVVWALLFGAGVGIGLVVLLDVVMVGPRDKNGIPAPPPGYRYCTNGEQLDFCPLPGGERK